MDEYNVYKIISIGVAISLIINIIGLFILIFHAEKSVNFYPSIDRLISGLFALNPISLIYLGILILILTPFAALVYISASYIAQKERGMIILSLVILGIVILVTLMKLLLL